MSILATAPPNVGAAAATERLGAVSTWLFACCAMIFLMVVIGGITRLTLSGLSITEWKPIIGIVPPLSAAEWAAEFAKYKEIPEYRILHFGMTLDEFKIIYFWEFAHRLFGRLIALGYAVPLAWFFARGRLPRRLVPALLGILLLGSAQGALGWYMVESGLADRVEVSQYRLAAHLALALTLYAAILWVALGILPASGRPEPGAAPSRRWRHAAEIVIALVALTIIAGGFVAGTRAGLTYNTFPLMDGHLLPAGYAQLRPFVLNWFENVAAVQFNHRLLAVSTTLAILLLWAAGRHTGLPKPARTALDALLGAAAMQMSLGVATLLLVVPIPLAAAHQAGAVLLLTAAIVFRHTLGRARFMDAAPLATI